MTFPKTIAITGANGFLGRNLVGAFVKAGHSVIGLCRNPGSATPSPGVTFRYFSLDFSEPCDFGNAEVVVHCAHEMNAPSRNTSANIEGSTKLIQSARDRGINIAYISSIVASATGYSRYAREKFAVERSLDPGRDLIIRPGLVLGDAGLSGSMVSALRRSAFVPIFSGGRQPIYPVDVDDLANTIVQLVVGERTGTYVLASPSPITMRDLYGWAGVRAGTQPRFVPLPFSATLFLVRLLERIGLRLPVTSESIAGIRNLRLMEVPHYAEISVAFAPPAVNTDLGK